MLADVQADVAARRAAGELLPFGAPGRVPRVYVDGCFDMMHSGHMNAVRQAKLIADSVGGLLIVGVVDTMGRVYLPLLLRQVADRSVADAAGPALASMSVYLLMALVLALRPQGLFPAHRT